MAATLRGMLLKGQVWVDPDGSTAVPTASDMAGFCDKGSVLVDGGNGALYVNTGTPAAPAWTAPQLFTGLPTASASLSFLRLGNTDIVSGDSNGTWIGINAPSGSTAAFADFQIAGSRKFQITKDGFIGVRTSPSTDAAIRVFLDTQATTNHGVWSECVYSGASTLHGGRFNAYNAASTDIAAYSVEGVTFYRGTASTTAINAGGYFGVSLDGAGTSQTISDGASAFFAATGNFQTGTTTFTRRSGILVDNMGQGHGSSGLTITNAFGIHIRQQTGAATLNYCLVTTDTAGTAIQFAIDGNGRDFIFDATTGSKLGTATSQKIGVWNATPVIRQSAFTQTYATATKTHSNPTATTLTAASGTADGTVADVGAAFNQTTLNNNFQDVSTAINALIVDMANVKGVLNSVVDDLQTIGWLA